MMLYYQSTRQRLKAAATEVTSLKLDVEKLKKQLADAQAALAREESVLAPDLVGGGAEVVRGGD